MMLLGILVGLALGLVFGGRLDALLNVRLRFVLLLLGALVVRYGTQYAIASGIPLVDSLRLPLYSVAFAVLVAALWLNRFQPGLTLVMGGVAANAIAIVVNGGYMPAHLPALAAAGLGPSDLSPTFNILLPQALDLQFLLRAGPLGDIIPFPFAPLNNVVSFGDLLMTVGLGWFVLATLLRGNRSTKSAGVTIWRGREVQPTSFDRPIMLGGGHGALLPPTAGPAAPPILGARRPGRDVRLSNHPYLRLAKDARFGAFWVAQTVSLLGDRLNQVALGFLVLAVTGSPLATGLVFLAATLPNLFLGPIAGPFVDRWDQKRVMVISDLLRGGLVVVIPIAAQTNIVLVYPLVFLVTTVSLFFRPAKAAVVPRIVAPDDLLAANSAVWTAETIADIAGYPLAGLLVALLSTQLALAFWIDAASYLVSALLIVGLTIPLAVRAAAPPVAGAVRAFTAELREGWHVLRRQPTLFQNTIVSAVAQLSVGTTLALTIVYARDALDGRFIPYPQNYAAIDWAIGIGNLIGGLAVGAIGGRLRKGWMVVIGFVVMGVATLFLGLTQNALVALSAAFVIGVFNLVYVIPTQTLFAQLTPEGFMGRVVAFRSSLVFGAMTLSMAFSSIAAEHLPVGMVIAAGGVITLLAGLAAALLPAVRDPQTGEIPVATPKLRARPATEDG
jgi:DHA3 family macrolide efflux protein-like MFS transporter